MKRLGPERVYEAMIRSTLLFSLALASCAQDAVADVPAPLEDVKPAGGLQTAVFAAGCFWCVEAVFEAVEGVTTVVSGYAGDVAENAKYDLVGAGGTKHAEAVEITYDPSKVTYGQLLHVLFVTSEPTVKDRQGPDAGTQYRMAIFPRTDEEEQVARRYIAQLEAAKVYSKPIVTAVERLTAFYPAEKYHQDFVRLNPNHPYVRTWSTPKIMKFVKVLPARVKKKAG